MQMRRYLSMRRVVALEVRIVCVCHVLGPQLGSLSPSFLPSDPGLL